MRRVTVIVAGVPVGQGSMKAVPLRNGKGARVTHNQNGKLMAWRSSIVGATHRQLGEEIELFSGPLRLSAAFRLYRPKKIPKENMGRPIGKMSGDSDKYLRALGDALTGVLFLDDAQIVDAHVTKAYCNPGAAPGVVFTLEEVE